MRAKFDSLAFKYKNVSQLLYFCPKYIIMYLRSDSNEEKEHFKLNKILFRE